jgi:pyridoxamine 5'-phosphate oxidase
VSIAHIRKHYTRGGLRRADLPLDPFRQFQLWLDDAIREKVPEPTAMTLATVGADGRPSARIVLLKGLDSRGFSFFTNYESRKGRELAAAPQGALVFLWAELERQVRIEGRVTRLPRDESESYFRSRPRGHQLGAWVSRQSVPIADHAVLERRLEEFESRFADGEVPLPDFWGGYVLAPDRIEFWQGRPNRLHDRFLYSRAEDGGWTIERLSP